MPENNSASSLSKRTSCHIYIWNLPEDFRKKETRNLFNSVVGNVIYAEVLFDKNGKSRSCAIVEFESADMAKEAIRKMHRMEVKGRKINVKSREDAMSTGLFKREKHEPSSLPRPSSLGEDSEMTLPSTSADHSEVLLKKKRPSTSADDSEVLPKKKRKHSRGERRKKSNLAKKNLNTAPPFRQPSRVKREDFNLDREKEQKNKLVAINDKRGGSSHMGGSSYTGGWSYRGGSSFLSNSGLQDTSSQWKHGQTYGIPVSFLESLGINGPLGPGIFVINLDHKVTEDDLRDLFKIAGTVVDTEIMRDSDGKSRGFATVEFEHPLQSVQAIMMINNQLYFNRRIAVALDKFNDQRGSSFTKLPKGLRGVGFGLGVNGEAIKEASELSQFQRELNVRTGTSNTVANNYGTGVNPSPPLSRMTGLENPGYNFGLGLGALASALSALSVGGYGNNTSGILDRNAQASSTDFSLYKNAQASSNVFSLDRNSQASSTDFSLDRNAQASSTDFSLDSVIAKNLPYDCTSWDLRKLFSKFGNVKYVEIKKNGIGFARLSSAAEARLTADMLDKYWFNDRHIEVRCLNTGRRLSAR